MATVIGIDPGKTTGYVVLYDVNLATGTYKLGEHYTIAWEYRYQLKPMLASAVGLLGIAMENFKIYPQMVQTLGFDECPSAKVIERVTVYCEELKLVHLIDLPMASTLYISKGKKFSIPYEHNKLLTTQHQKDAYLHARLFILRNKKRGY